MIKDCWHFFNTYFHDEADSVSLLFLHLKVANTSFMNVCNQMPVRLPKMLDQKLLSLLWHWFLGGGRECITVLVPSNSCQYLIYWCLQSISTLVTPDAKPKICCNFIDADFQNGAVTMLQSLLPINAANTSVLHNCNRITFQSTYSQDQISLTLCWC